VRLAREGVANGVAMQMPQQAHKRSPQPKALLGALALILLTACVQPKVELQNTRAARQLARETAAPRGSLYAGWRIYQQRCAGCHGAAADGQDAAPNLLVRLRDVGPQRFVDLVLRRYERDALPIGAGSPRDTIVDEVVERKRGELQMPAWQNEPVVAAHVMDLYAYLSARAEGRVGPARPTP
jgi:Cytochrome C oxidase, cbb3-type, subunit III